MKKIFSALVSLSAISLIFSFLINANLKKVYRVDEYIPELNAYYGGEITDSTGYIKANKSATPSDNKYSEQLTRSLGTGLIGDIESVWSSYTGKGTTIAVIDDGFDYDHPEYTRQDGTSAILSTSRYYFSSGNSYDYKKYSDDPTCIAEDWESDGNGGYEWATHGTATSTTAAAPMNNGGGVGIAPEANILAIKVDFTFASLKGAILYAVSQGVDVINMSLGAYAESFIDGWGDQQEGSSNVATYLESACQAAYNAGIIVVAAAGNESTWHKSYPACNYKVIGVGATGEWYGKGNANKLAEFTNYVKSNQTGEINVDILAPGYVYTAERQGTQNNPTHTFDDTQGTSFSCPIIAGAACLWKQKYPNGTPDQFLNQLQSSADGIGYYTNKYIPVSGWYSDLTDVGPSEITNGRLNAAKLMEIDDPFVSTVQSNISISIGEKRQIDLDTYNGTITYSSNNTNVATVSNTGLVEGVGEGNATITVTATKNNKTATDTVSVTVNDAVASTSISFNPKSVTLSIGETYDSAETITVTPSNASRIFLFESEDKNVATVDVDTGLITAVGSGTTDINVVSGYGSGYDTLSVTVSAASEQNAEITFGKGTGDLNVNGNSVSGDDSLSNTWTVTTSGTTSFTPQDDYAQIGSSSNAASSITFSMSLDKVAEFTSVSAVFGGFNGTSGTVAIKVDSTSIGSGSVPSSDDVTITNSSTAFGSTLSITITNISKGIKAYSISYSYRASSGPVPTVTSVTVTPSILNLDLNGTTTGNLSATVNGTNSPAQTVSWTTSNSSVATVSNSGVVTAKSVGSAVITATSTIDSGKSGTCSVTVVDTTPKSLSSITISGYETSFHVDDTFTFGGTVTANYSDNSHADVTSSSSFSGYDMSHTGVQTVTVSYTYANVTKTASYQITVTSSGTSNFSGSYDRSNVGSSWSLSDYSDQSTYLRCPENGNSSIALFTGIFDGREIASSVVVTIENATFGNGGNPSASTFKICSDKSGSTEVTSTQTGALPTSSDYKTTVYTVGMATATNSFSDDLSIKITKPGKQIRIKTITIEFDYISTPKVIDSISATYSGSDIYVDDTLDESKVEVTATYTNSTRYPNEILASTDYSLSGFSSATSGQKTITVAYTGSVATLHTPLTTTFNVTVLDDSITSVDVVNNKTYHPGDVINKSDITVTAHYSSGKSLHPDFTFEDDGYMFTYSDAASGGSNTSKQFSITYLGNNYSFEVNVSRVAYQPVSSSTATLSSSQFRSSNLSDSINTPSPSTVTIGSYNFAVTTNAYVFTTQDVSYISFGKTAGSIQNASAFNSDLSSITIIQKDTARQDGILTISKDGSNWVAYSVDELAKGDYRYFKYAYVGNGSGSGASEYSNIKSISFTLSGKDYLNNVCNYIMYEDTANQCITKFDSAITKLNNMSSADKNSFWTSNSYVVATARERLVAWSKHLGKELNYQNGSFSISNSKNIFVGFDRSENNGTMINLIVISSIGLLTISGYFIIRRKKQK